ncbi:MAG: helix-turn-helix domain-containing protein [Xanthomonadaceae bacterium]|nr:helix-turn-helix domain-containing protein [Xanthomonadaceae bacterium]
MNDAPSVELASNDADATPGALLKRERERAALTVQQAAEDLHLDPWIIEAIEDNRFLALGAPVYARGHLRKYATRLGVPVSDILERYEALQDRPHEPEPIPAAVAAPIRPPRRSLKGPAWTAVSIAALGLAGYFAFELFYPRLEPTPQVAAVPSTSPSTPRESRTPPPVEQPSFDAESVPEDTPSAPSVPEATTASVAAPPEETSTGSESNAAGESLTAAAPIRVRLEYSGESWTEVYDATGARLLYGMGTPQRARTLVGVPPIQVSLGAVSAVSLHVNGEPVPIPRREGREFTRFTIDSDGNLR